MSSTARTSYLVCATPRSGTSLLCEALKSTGVAGRPEEYFWDQEFWRRRWSVSTFGDYLRAALVEGTTSNGVFGAKLMWRVYREHLEPKLRSLPRFASVPECELLPAAFPDVRYVFVTRRDKVRQAVSFFKAIRTGAWTRREQESAPNVSDADFDLGAIDELVREIHEHEAAWHALFDRCGAEPLVIVYEDLVEDREDAVRRVLDLLEVRPPERLRVEVPLRRQADELSERWVHRYLAERAG